MHALVEKVDKAEQTKFYEMLMSYSQGHDNDHILSCILSSWQFGDGALPDWLGLGQAVFSQLIEFHFPGLEVEKFSSAGESLEEERFDEREELQQLFTTHYAGQSESEQWMASIVVNACQGQDHLWQDLGLWSRKDLTLLMQQNFPTLAARNDKDMKWKKFLYKQLCIAEGIYTCRAPSCQVCADYADCFGPEE